MSYLDENERFSFRTWSFATKTGPDLVWWRPSVREVLRHAGWGWWTVLILPIAAAVGQITGGFLGGPAFDLLRWTGYRLLLLALLIPFLVWDALSERVFRARKDPYCIHCGYTLIGLPEEGVCPECGRSYRMIIVQMFRRDPQWVMAWWRFNGKPPSVAAFEAGHRREFRINRGGTAGTEKYIREEVEQS
jgi:hypothetical protein